MKGLKIDNSLNKYLKINPLNLLAIDFEKTSTGNLVYWLLGREWLGSFTAGKLQFISKDNKMIFNPAFRFIFLLNDNMGRIYYGNEHDKFFIEKTTHKIHSLTITNGFTTGGGNSIFITAVQNKISFGEKLGK